MSSNFDGKSSKQISNKKLKRQKTTVKAAGHNKIAKRKTIVKKQDEDTFSQVTEDLKSHESVAHTRQSRVPKRREFSTKTVDSNVAGGQ